jgi:cyanophycin synthetase
MNILSVRHIEGPNMFIYKPVLIARIDLGPLTERESCDFPGFADRLLALLPGLRDHHCAKGAPGGFVERLYGGTYFGHILEHTAIELACLTGLEVHYGKTVYAGALGQYDIVIECQEYPAQRRLLERALEIVEAARTGRDAGDIVADALREAADILAKTALGPSTRAIAEAALRRGIPVRRLDDASLLQLGHGIHRRLVEATLTDRTSAVAVDIACDKVLTNRLLSDAGIPTPDGGVALSAKEAVDWLRRLGAPVVVKPYNGNQGRGVSLALETPEAVEEAFERARKVADRVIVERYIPGRNLRLLVVNGRMVAASERVPAHVVGDGLRTVRELVECTNQDPLRGEDHEKPLTRIPVDIVAEAVLRRQGMRWEDVPAAGRIVWLRDSANLSTGGEAIDVTDDLHPSYRWLAERAARIVGLDVCGVDMVVERPDHPYRPGAGYVIEVNASPGIRMHLHPSHGLPRKVADAIVNALYPVGNGRIPIVAITGTNGKTTTTRLIGHGLASIGKTVGVTTTGGVYVGGKLVMEGDTTGPASARLVLSDPTVEAAVLETARGGIVRGGLAYDRAHVAVLTNISLDHVGQDGVESIEDLVHIKSLVAECVLERGTVVLNADDPHLVRLAQRLNSRIAWFSLRSDNPMVRRHVAVGGWAYYVSGGQLIEARGHQTWAIAGIREIPLTMGGTAGFHIENCLAAAAALRALGLTRQQVAVALRTFLPDQNTGRLAVYRMPNGSRTVLDYGHNPDGFVKVGQWLCRLPHRRLIGVVGVPGDRADAVIHRSAEVLAGIFDQFVVKEDRDLRGRAPGEVAQMMAQRLAEMAPGKRLDLRLDEEDALRYALGRAESGDIVVMFYEKWAPADRIVRELGGVPDESIYAAAREAVTAAP